MSRLSIKWKLALVALMCAVGMLTLLTYARYTATRVAEMEHTRLEVSDIRSGMLTLRRNEKDFLARNDLKYHGKFTAHYQALQDQVNDLARHMSAQGLDASEARKLGEILAQYAKRFDSLVATQKRVGLSHKQGLQGSLRKAVHAAEKRLASIGDVQLTKDMLMLRRREKDFLLRMDPKYLKKFEKDYAVFMRDLDARPLSDTDKAMIRADMTRYRRDFRAMVTGYQAKGLTSEQGVLGQMRRTVHQSETQLAKMADLAASHINEEIARLERIGLAVSLTVMAVLLGLITWLAISIRRPIRRLSELMQTVRHDNDLTLRAEVDGRDEIAHMATDFNHMMDEFQQMLKQVQGSADQLGTAAEELTAIAATTNDGVSRQSGETEQVATAVNEMTATVQEVARNANATADASRSVSEQVQTGRDLVDRNRSGIQELANAMTTATEVIAELNRESEHIGTVLNVIREIAEQTNLLALNAAIEAARAGEQGRGFAVVADEVRTLAQRSQTSTQEIEDIVTRLQDSAARAVSTMNTSQGQVEHSVENAETMARVLNDITAAVTHISDMNLQIAGAAEEQATVVDEINRNVANISTIASDSASSARETTQTSGALAELAADLQQQVARFRVG